MENNDADVVISYGPPHVGKTLYYWQKRNSSYIRVCPKEEFQLAPSLNLRRLIFTKVIQPLKQGDRVFLDGCNWKETGREAVISLVQKKKPSCKFLCLKFQPKHGRDQLLWQQEVHLAEWQELDKKTNIELHSRAAIDGKIDTWFNTDMEARTEFIDEPLEEEGFCIEKITLPLTVQSTFQLEVPCLMVEWGGICLHTNQGIKMATGAVPSLTTWYRHNPAGRIIIIADGNLPPGGNMVERHTHILYILKQLIAEVPDCPIYLYCVELQLSAGIFHQPPNPGIIVFLMRLHHLDLLHKSSLYLYDSQLHQKMAAAVGIRHLKASKLFSRPHLAASTTHAAIIPPILRDMEVCNPVGDGWITEPSVPLYNQLSVESQGFCSQCLGHGRRLYAAVKNTEVLRRYQEQYKDLCARTGSGPSRIGALTITPSTVDHNQSAVSTGPRSSSVHRDLPKWMMPKPKKEISESGKESADLNESNRFRKTPMKKIGTNTVYVMSPAELLAYARKILEEAGKPVSLEGQHEGADHSGKAKDKSALSGHTEGNRAQESTDRSRRKRRNPDSSDDMAKSTKEVTVARASFTGRPSKKDSGTSSAVHQATKDSNESMAAPRAKIWAALEESTAEDQSLHKIPRKNLSIYNVSETVTTIPETDSSSKDKDGTFTNKSTKSSVNLTVGKSEVVESKSSVNLTLGKSEVLETKEPDTNKKKNVIGPDLSILDDFI